MIDAVLFLDAAGHDGPITAVSRRGLLPRAHAQGGAPVLPPVTLDEVPRTLSASLRWLRKRSACEKDWRLAVDSLRPVTQQLWQRMDEATRKRFLRHARPWWDVHRHRIAPEVCSRIDALRTGERLKVIAGALVGSTLNDDRYRVEIAVRGSGAHVEVDAGLVINCTGPLSSVRSSKDPLVRQMVLNDLIRPDALDLGVEVDDDHRLAGCTNAFAIGPMTRGRYWEITAVPDIRVQAAEIAQAISRASQEATLETALL
jgi:uncharacterized NAD(P)/FAD-binding protein YdhS